MAIFWTVDGHLEGSAADGFRSRAASNRYRILIPRERLVACGQDVRIVRLPLAGDAEFPSKPDALILGKIYPAGDRQDLASRQSLALAKLARAQGARVIVDVNDNHFDDPAVGWYWREAVRLADVCVVGSQAMAGIVGRHTERPIRWIGDPLGSPAGEARVVPWSRGLLDRLRSPTGTQQLEVVWYGALNNVTAMEHWANAVAPLARVQPLRIRLVTKPHSAIDRLVDAYKRQHEATIEFIEWSEEAQWNAVAASHLVMIPTDVSDSKKAVKTGNRLTDAINAGRYVIASPLEAYMPFGDYCTLTHDPLNAVKAYLARPAAALARLRSGQDAVRRQFGADAIARAWISAIQGD
jgi:hypothetical protein